MDEGKAAYFEGREGGEGIARLYRRRLGDVNSVLDIGCGTGWIGEPLTREGIEVIGVDNDPGALRDARQRESETIRVNIEASGLPFDDQTFDGVIAKDILEHLVRPGPAVEEISRVLRPGGVAVVSVPMAKPSVVYDDYTHIRGFTESAVKTLFRDYGFIVTDTSPMGGIPGFGRLGLTQFLPVILRLPILSRFAVSHELIARKPD